MSHANVEPFWSRTIDSQRMAGNLHGTRAGLPPVDVRSRGRGLSTVSLPDISFVPVGDCPLLLASGGRLPKGMRARYAIRASCVPQGESTGEAPSSLLRLQEVSGSVDMPADVAAAGSPVREGQGSVSRWGSRPWGSPLRKNQPDYVRSQPPAALKMAGPRPRQNLLLARAPYCK